MDKEGAVQREPTLEEIRAIQTPILNVSLGAVERVGATYDYNVVVAALRRSARLETEIVGALERIVQSFPPLPLDGSQFTLVVDFTGPRLDPIAMVREAGEADAADWRYVNPGHCGVVTVTCKLIPILGQLKNIGEVERKIQDAGWRVPTSRCLQEFSDRYLPNNKTVIAVADDDWIDPDGDSRFPYLDAQGNLRFGETSGPIPPAYWLAIR